MLLTTKIDVATMIDEDMPIYDFFRNRSKPYYIDLSKLSQTDARILYNAILYRLRVTTARDGRNMYIRFLSPIRSLLKHYDDGLSLEQYLVNYLKQRHCKNYERVARQILDYIFMTKKDDQVVYDDVINLDKLNVSEVRKGPYKQRYIDCRRIKDKTNRQIVIRYLISLVTETDLSISTIKTKFLYMVDSLNSNENNCTVWTDNDIRNCFIEITHMNLSNNSKRDRISSITNFFNYLSEEKIIINSSVWVIANEFNIKVQTNYRKTAPSPFVVQQFFSYLDSADETTKLMLLILYCTGMRISELQHIKRDCLERRNNATFIRFYQSKMRKEVSNIIPEKLALMIESYVQNNPVESDYLFCNRNGEYYWPGSLRWRMVNFFNSKNIKNEDGTPYHFTPHSLRHYMAVRMHQYKIPYRYIQEQLHHENSMMTLFYIEYLDNSRLEKMRNWISNKGEHITMDDLKMKIKQAQLQSAVIPGGLCTRPARLPSCNHCNACYMCQYFTTSKDYLPMLNKQKQRLQEFLIKATTENWEKAVKNSKDTLEHLERIITKLEAE